MKFPKERLHLEILFTCQLTDPAAQRLPGDRLNRSWSQRPTRWTTLLHGLLSRTNAAVKAATGKEPTLFRPPYGAVNAQVKAAQTLSPVLWDVGPAAERGVVARQAWTALR